MTVVQLKDELRSRGLRLGGKKAELVERLGGATAAEAVATAPAVSAAVLAPASAPVLAVPAAAAADASAALDAGFRLLERTMAELPTAELEQTFVHHQVAPTLALALALALTVTLPLPLPLALALTLTLTLTLTRPTAHTV